MQSISNTFNGSSSPDIDPQIAARMAEVGLADLSKTLRDMQRVKERVGDLLPKNFAPFKVSARQTSYGSQIDIYYSGVNSESARIGLEGDAQRGSSRFGITIGTDAAVKAGDPPFTVSGVGNSKDYKSPQDVQTAFSSWLSATAAPREVRKVQRKAVFSRLFHS